MSISLDDQSRSLKRWTLHNKVLTYFEELISLETTSTLLGKKLFAREQVGGGPADLSLLVMHSHIVGFLMAQLIRV